MFPPSSTVLLPWNFKSMLSPDTDGHKLMDLFNSFEENIKQEIKEKSISKLEKLAWGKSFEQYLEDINNVFVDWRYIHEKNYNVKYLSNGANEFLQVLSILLPVISEIARKYAIVNDI